MTERRKYKVIDQGSFSRLCDFLATKMTRPSVDRLTKELKEVGIAPTPFRGPSVSIETDRIQREREELRRKNAKEELLEKLKARPEEEISIGSPMGDLGTSGSIGFKIPRARDSDGEIKNQ